MFGKKNSTLTEQDVLAALKGVKDPDLHRDLVDLGMIKDIKVGDGSVSLTVNLTTPACPLSVSGFMRSILRPLLLAPSSMNSGSAPSAFSPFRVVLNATLRDSSLSLVTRCPDPAGPPKDGLAPEKSPAR